MFIMGIPQDVVLVNKGPGLSNTEIRQGRNMYIQITAMNSAKHL